VKEWGAASLADPELGGNNPEQLAKMSTLAKEVVAKFGDKESIEFIESNPLGVTSGADLRLLTASARRRPKDRSSFRHAG
jgi:succinyl-CoA synthetase beta subunit